MAEIKKASFFVSWFEVAKTMNAERALAFYNAIFDYYFYNIEPESDSIVREAFALIKPNIDKDKRNKKGGAPAGNSNAKKQPQNLCFPLNSFDLKKQTDVDDDDRCMKYEEEEDDDDEVRIPQEFHRDFHKISTLSDFINYFDLDISKGVKTQIQRRLKTINEDIDFLIFCFEKIKEKYPDSENITGAFVSAVLSWDNLLFDYQAERESKLNERKCST